MYVSLTGLVALVVLIAPLFAHFQRAKQRDRYGLTGAPDNTYAFSVLPEIKTVKVIRLWTHYE